MNIWLKLRKTAAIALCELLAIAIVFTGCASADLSGTEGAGHAAGAVVADEDSSGALGRTDNVDGAKGGSDPSEADSGANGTVQADAGKPQEDLVNNNSYVSLDAIPAYDGKAYVAVNNNEPFFTDSDMTTTAFENYSDLDSLGRCGVAYANICKDIMPTEERGKIGMIKPSGWHTVKYDVIKDRYLYNRCHLIGYQLAGENANPKNLITGTRYLNVEGMLPFENLVADYVNNTGNHVLYRVTPMFSGSNLVANGVLIEAKSVEDDGGGILFNVYCYNVQPGVTIDYATGDSALAEDLATENVQETAQETSVADGKQSSENAVAAVQEETSAEQDGGHAKEEQDYVLNKNTKKFHYPWCSSADDIKKKNRKDFTGTREEVISQGYVPCKRCNP